MTEQSAIQPRGGEGTLRPSLLVKASLKIGLGLLLTFFLLELLSSALWLGRLQRDRIAGETDQNHIEDFVAYYAAGQLVLEGRGSELYDVTAIAAVEHETMGRPVGGSGILPYFNPPFVAVALAPMTALEIELFSTLLLAIVLGMVIAGGVGLSAYIGLEKRSQRAIFWLLYLSCFPTIWVVAEQQLSMFLFIGYLGFAWFQIQGQPSKSGLALALVLVKPQMAILPLLVLLWKRQWTAVIYFGAAGTLAGSISVAVAGPQVLFDYPLFLMESTSWEEQGVNASRMFGWNSVIATVTGNQAPSLAFVSILIVPMLVLVAFALRDPWEPGDARTNLKIGMLILASLLMNLHLYMQDLVLLALVVGLLAAYSQRMTGSLGISTYVAFGLWILTHYSVQLMAQHSLPVVSLAMGCLLLMYAALVLRPRPARHEELHKAGMLSFKRLSSNSAEPRIPGDHGPAKTHEGGPAAATGIHPH